RPRGLVSIPGRGREIVGSLGIVFRKEIHEILRDRRTLIAIALAVLATPTVLFVISQVATRTATQTYTVGYSGDIPTGLDTLFGATGLKLERVDDPPSAAKKKGEKGIVFTAAGSEEYSDPSRRGGQITNIRLQAHLSRYAAEKFAAYLQQKGVDPSI